MPRAYTRQTKARPVFRLAYPRPVRRRYLPSKTASVATLNYYTGAMANAKRLTRGLGF